MKRVLIDLTDLEIWSGVHGGTQRVVYGIAKHFYLNRNELEHQVYFMVFSPQTNQFHKTSFEPIYERVERSQSEHVANASVNAPSRRALIKRHIQPYVPESIRSNPRLRKAAARSLSQGMQFVGQAKQFAKRLESISPSRITEPIIFSKDDTVLMLGKPWDNLNIQRSLSKEKSRVNFKLAQVVYDLIIPLQPHLHHTSLFTAYTQHMFEAVAASDLLLPISKSSARDLKEFCRRLNLTAPKVKVIRLGDELAASSVQESTKPSYRIADEFIACVGTIEIRKNHMLLYNAYKLALQENIELPQMVIVGSKGWLSSDLQYLIEHDPAIQEKVIILDNISDAGLKWVYQNCKFTVYPSMYEGWGLPVAESLARGKVCVATNSSSVPEIAGGLIDYFSPYDPRACLEAMTKYLDPQVLKAKEQQIESEYKIHGWSHTYTQTYNAIKELINGEKS